MDGLALLCNLHADGPMTLHHLRSGGCGSLRDVAHRHPADLESLLGWSAKTVRRFQREARILAARLESGPPGAKSGERDEVHGTEGGTGFLEEHEAESDSHPREREGVAGEGVPAALPSPAGDRRGGEEAPSPADRPSPWADRMAPDPPPEEETRESRLERPLSPALCEGLSPDLVTRLARAGVHTLGELVDGDVLEIASLIGVGYTRLARLRFLVRRHLEAEEAGTGRRVEVVPAPPRPPATPPGAGDRLGASGPFA